MSSLVPRSYKSFNKTIKVHLDPLMDKKSREQQKEWNTGIFMRHTDEIELQPPTRKFAMTKEEFEVTFFHEFTHQLFYAAGRNDLCDDEALVTVIGTLLLQYLTSKKGSFTNLHYYTDYEPYYKEEGI